MSAAELHDVPVSPVGPTPPPRDDTTDVGASIWKLAFRRMRRNPGAIVGAAIVVVFMVRQSGANTIQIGDIYLLGTVLSGAFGYTLSGRLSRTRPGWEVISWQVASFLPLSLIAAYLLWPQSFAGVPASAWAGLTYVSFVSQFFAFFVFNAAMAMAGVARSGQ